MSTHDETSDCVWSESEATTITFSGLNITTNGTGVAVAGSQITVSAAGTYVIHGTLSDGQIVVDAEDNSVVRLVLDEASISSSSGAPIVVSNAEKVVIVTTGENSIADAATYTSLDDDNEPNAALFSKSNLTICGSGSLSVTGSYNDGITSKDGLIVKDASVTVKALDDGIRGKDYLVLNGGNISVIAGGDGIKADNDEDTSAGYISIAGSNITITSSGDAIAATTDVLIDNGTVDLTSGGGSDAIVNSDVSAKGLKGLVSVLVNGGNLTVNSADDAIHSNGSIVINGGTLALSSGDDGVHADSALTINDGTINVLSSYEGLESAIVILNGGSTHVNASDDGVNVAGGADSSGTTTGPGVPGAPGDSFTTSSNDYRLEINGGYLVVNAEGDGLDSNGTCAMTDGKVLVNGPTGSANAAIDCGEFTLSGGFLVSVHTLQMADEISGTYAQNLVNVSFLSQYQGENLIHVEDSSGANILTYAPPKAYKSLIFTSPNLVNGSYQLYVGGSSTGTLTDGLYTDGTYTPGTLFQEFTISSTTTQIGSRVGGGSGIPGGGF
jgi:hypothetical protein